MPHAVSVSAQLAGFAAAGGAAVAGASAASSRRGAIATSARAAAAPVLFDMMLIVPVLIESDEPGEGPGFGTQGATAVPERFSRLFAPSYANRTAARATIRTS